MEMPVPRFLLMTGALALAACSDQPPAGANATVPAGKAAAAEASATPDAMPFAVQAVATLDSPWAMAFLPDGRLLVTEKPGRLRIVSADGTLSGAVAGTPAVNARGQAGLMDVVLHPDFANNRYVYLSFSEPGSGGLSGTALMRARLVLDDEGGGRLEGGQVIWRQEPEVSGNGHYSGRIAFSPDGFMFVSSGERQKFDPAQDMTQNLGKIVRLSDTGMIPSDNPFYDQGRIKAQVWSYGHRNVLGIAFDGQGRLWAHEMGPKGGDEFNLIERGANYGYPIVSDGDHYDGRPIPDHATRPEFAAPKAVWTPVISPAGLIIYSGDLFPAWKGSAFIGGLSSKALVRVAIDGDTAREVERFDMGKRIRDVEQGPDGAIWVLEDEAGGRLLRLTPRG